MFYNKSNSFSQVLEAHACNPSYVEGLQLKDSKGKK
jgi:hypothetical protein